MTVRTRFAPSPTGSLHVGGARTALYCMLFARQHGGTFLLRIEDTDRARSTDESTRGILRDLAWLGLDWDEGPERGGEHGPYFQSQRRDLYDRFFEQLLAAGHAYEAWESREELGALRDAARAEGKAFRYPRPTYTDEQVAAYRAEGRVPVLRLKAPDHDVTVEDAVLGTVTVAASELDDIVIRKADGYPTYHFAVVIDDHHMAISHVLRGKEHLMNSHKHMGLYEALRWSAPTHGHMPLIFNPGGSKMSKRDKAKAARAAAREAAKAGGHQGWDWLAEPTGYEADALLAFMKKTNDDLGIATAIASHLGVDLPMIEVMDFRRGGYLPEALLNYLALLGWSPGDDREILSLHEMVQLFSVDRIGSTSARFDPDKLRWMNGEYLRSVPEDRLVEVTRRWLEVVDSPLADLTESRLRTLLRMYRERVHTLAEMDDNARFFFEAPTTWDPKAVAKHLRKGGGYARLAALRGALAEVDPWDPEHLEAAFDALAGRLDVRMGKLAQPARIAVSGSSVSPPIYDTLAFLGRDEVLRRLDACLAAQNTAGE